MVGAQEAKHDAGEQQAGGVADAEAEGAELEGDHADHQADDKEGAEGQQVGHLAVNGDKADAIGYGLHAAGVAADLQHVAFVQHHVVVDRHLDLAANNPV